MLKNNKLLEIASKIIRYNLQLNIQVDNNKSKESSRNLRSQSMEK